MRDSEYINNYKGILINFNNSNKSSTLNKWVFCTITVVSCGIRRQ